jgi:hypothetical protein
MLLSLLLTVPASAGAPPASCSGGANGCDLESDVLVFAEGDTTYEITAQITDCYQCVDHGDGTFDLDGRAEIDWGPYDPTLCAVSNGTTELHLSYDVLTMGAGAAETTYIPATPTDQFHPNIPTPLRPDCVSADNMAYAIPWVVLTGADGARSGISGTGDDAWLDLPELVRAEEGGVLMSRISLEQFHFAQGLSLNTSRIDLSGSTLRFWPDGLPFKLGPHVTTFTETEVSFSADDSSGPQAYTPFPPHSANLTTGPGGQVITCDPAKPDFGTDPCTTDSISNGSYFDSTSWQVTGDPSFDNDGLDVVLDLPLGFHVTYETLFPRGVWAKLEGPATLTVTDSTVDSGTFSDGTAWLRIWDGDLCETIDGRERTFPLENDYGLPQIGAGGSLLAGVEDLTPLEPIDWAASTAEQLECGTLYIPPVQDDLLPQIGWNGSAVPTVLNRGIYAGFNYNRNRVCHDSAGTALEKTCASNGDCDTGSGEYCDDGGFSPLCGTPTGGYDPQWRTEIEGESKSFLIDPDNASHGDREMAFFVRRSGVTGVFDGGDDQFTLGNVNGMEFEFDSYGLAYEESRNSGQDTIVAGGVVFPWPSLTTVPFEEMSVCDCGTMDNGKAPEYLVENNLMYWNAIFYPYGLRFVSSLNTDGTCPDPATGGCVAPSTAVCITALTPIPRLKPDPTSEFPLDYAGEPQTFEPLSQPRLNFDESVDPVAAPYTYDIEHFKLNTHPSAATYDAVIVNQTEPYGHYETSGDLSIPYFGLTPAGIQVMTEVVSDIYYNPVNLFEEANLANSFVTASRAIAADTVAVDYKIDYFTPSATADPNDGTDIKRHGRGTLFAFADEPAQNLGAVHVAGGMIMTPEEIVYNAADLGPTAVMRLWGATEPTERTQLGNIIPVTYLAYPYNDMYDQALAELTFEKGYHAYTLTDPVQLKLDLHETGAMDFLESNPLASIDFNVGSSPPSPPANGERTTGYMLFSTPPDQVEEYLVTSNQNTGGEFYAVEGLLLHVDRHTKQDKMPITTVSREEIPGASQNMAMPGEQSIAFPSGGGGTKDGGSFFPGITWDVDFTMPGFQFESMTGSLDLTKGGLSGVGFDELCATLKFWADGDWYFDAGVKLNWSGYSVKGGVLLGNTIDMTPLRNRDPDVSDFLYGVTQFDGGYLGLGVSANAPIVDYGCFFRINAGAEVAGWYISQSYGGKVRGFVIGEGACLVKIRGDMTLIGGEVNDAYRIGGHFWAAGGIGDCDPGGWDTPGDVLDDDFCAACVFDCKAYATWPPDDVEIKLIGPDVDCAL